MSTSDGGLHLLAVIDDARVQQQKLNLHANAGEGMHACNFRIIYRIAGKFGGELNLAVYITTAKLKCAKISYSHIYVWQSCTELANLNSLIFLQ